MRGRKETNKVSAPGGGDHTSGGGELPGHAHAADHLGSRTRRPPSDVA